MTAPSSPEAPWPVRTVARKIADWIGRLGEVWVEGQVAQLSRRGGAATVFLTLRDPAADMSVPVTCHRDVADRPGLELTEGARVHRPRPARLLRRPRLVLAARHRDPRRRPRRAAGPHRAHPPAAGRRGALRRRPQAAAAVRAGRRRRHHRPGQRRRARRARDRPAALAGRPVRDVQLRRPGPAGRRQRHRGPAPARRRPGRRGHRDRPRRRLGRGPAAVLRRGAGAGDRRRPHARGHRRRPRDRHDAGRPRRRRPRRHPDRRRAPRSSPRSASSGGWSTGCAPAPAHVLTGRLEQQERWLESVRSRPVLASPDRLLHGREDDVVGPAHPRPPHRSCTASRAPSATSSTPAPGWPPSPPPPPCERGYAVVQRADGALVRDPAEVGDDERLQRARRRRPAARPRRPQHADQEHPDRMSTREPATEHAEPTTTYEQAREELADVVRRLEAGGLTLEESLALWERGEELAEALPALAGPGPRAAGRRRPGGRRRPVLTGVVRPGAQAAWRSSPSAVTTRPAAASAASIRSARRRRMPDIRMSSGRWSVASGASGSPGPS